MFVYIFLGNTAFGRTITLQTRILGVVVQMRNVSQPVGPRTLWSLERNDGMNRMTQWKGCFLACSNTFIWLLFLFTDWDPQETMALSHCLSTLNFHCLFPQPCRQMHLPQLFLTLHSPFQKPTDYFSHMVDTAFCADIPNHILWVAECMLPNDLLILLGLPKQGWGGAEWGQHRGSNFSSRVAV